MPEAELILKPGREKSLLRRHPWIFSGAVARVLGNPEAGTTLTVLDAAGSFLGWAAYSPKSQITARVWSWKLEEPVTPKFLQSRLERAVLLREPYIDGGNQRACRLVHAESDGLPGLVADRYGDTLVVQFLSWGAELLARGPGSPVTIDYRRDNHL